MLLSTPLSEWWSFDCYSKRHTCRCARSVKVGAVLYVEGMDKLRANRQGHNGRKRHNISRKCHVVDVEEKKEIPREVLRSRVSKRHYRDQ